MLAAGLVDPAGDSLWAGEAASMPAWCSPPGCIGLTCLTRRKQLSRGARHGRATSLLIRKRCSDKWGPFGGPFLCRHQPWAPSVPRDRLSLSITRITRLVGLGMKSPVRPIRCLHGNASGWDRGPSLKTCLVGHRKRSAVVLVRGRINLKLKLWVTAAAIRQGCQKLGQPVRLSNLRLELNIGQLEPCHRQSALRFFLVARMLMAGSVPSRLARQGRPD